MSLIRVWGLWRGCGLPRECLWRGRFSLGVWEDARLVFALSVLWGIWGALLCLGVPQGTSSCQFSVSYAVTRGFLPGFSSLQPHFSLAAVLCSRAHRRAHENACEGCTSPPCPAAGCRGLGSGRGPELGFAPFGFPLCDPLVPVAVVTLCQDTGATPVAVGTLWQDTDAIARIPALIQQCAGQVVLAVPPPGSQDDGSHVAAVPRNRGILQLCLCWHPRQQRGGEGASLEALRQVFPTLCWVRGSATTFLPGYPPEGEENSLADKTLAAHGEALVSECRCQPGGRRGFKPRVVFTGFHTMARLGTGMQWMVLPPECLQLVVALLPLRITGRTSGSFRQTLAGTVAEWAGSSWAPPACGQ